MLKKLENMTWTEVRDVAKETDIVLIPTGAVEQQGPHLPLGTDSIVAQYVAEKIAEKSNVVLAPTLSIGYSSWFKNYPGLITLRKETLTQVYREVCRSLAASGFKRQLFINPHLGNDDAIADAGVDLRAEGIIIGKINLWHNTSEITKAKDIPFKEKNFVHGGEVMTSIVMACAPEMVKMDKAVAEFPTSDIPGWQKTGLFNIIYDKFVYSIFKYTDEDTVSGGYGDPMAAAAENGKQIIDGWVDNIVAFIETFKQYQ